MARILLAATFFPVLGIVVLGLPALAVVAPVTLAWAVVVRRATSAGAASRT